MKRDQDLERTKKLVRMTVQRRRIWEALIRAGGHLDADQVYRLVKATLPRISLGTVYRNLEVLAEAKMIQRLDFSSGPRRYDPGTHPHYHIYCLNCGRIEDVKGKWAKDLKRLAEKLTHYQVVGHFLEFQGYCPGCQRRKRKKQNKEKEVKRCQSKGPKPRKIY